ncbi:slightly ste11-like protein [Microbotryomycetes sp. JL221]|nr:slightly ste11-like protein [Microbotryomycetes sp. JL221]
MLVSTSCTALDDSSAPIVQLEPPTPHKATFNDLETTLTRSKSIVSTNTTSTEEILLSPVTSPVSELSIGRQTSPVATSNIRHHPYSTSPRSRARTNSSSSRTDLRQRSTTMTSSTSLTTGGALSEWSTDAGEHDNESQAIDQLESEGEELDSDTSATFQDQEWQPKKSSRSSSRASKRTQSIKSASVSSVTMICQRPREASSSSSTAETNNKGPKASHSRKTAEGHIKRPPNAFILFRSYCNSPERCAKDHQGQDPPGKPTAEQMSSLNIIDHRHISQICSHLWKSLSPLDRKYWEDLALKKKIEHTKLYPNYRYKPVFRNKEEIKKKKHMTQKDKEIERDVCAKVASELLGEQVNVDPETTKVKPKAAPRKKKEGAPKSTKSRKQNSLTATMGPPTNNGETSASISDGQETLSNPQGESSIRQQWTFESLKKAMRGETDLPPAYPSTADPVAKARALQRKKPDRYIPEHVVSPGVAVFTPNMGATKSQNHQVEDVLTNAKRDRPSMFGNRKAPPTPLELAAPTFSTMYKLPSPKHRENKPPTDNTMSQLASFTFGSRPDLPDLDPTPTNTHHGRMTRMSPTRRLSTTGSPTAACYSDKWRRQSIMAGMRRRGTIELVNAAGLPTSSICGNEGASTPALSVSESTQPSITSVSADLMLISPIAPAFEGGSCGRRFSIGRWCSTTIESPSKLSGTENISDNIMEGMHASGLVGSVDDESLTVNATAFSLDPEFLTLLGTPTTSSEFSDQMFALGVINQVQENEETCGFDLNDLNMVVDSQLGEASDESGRPWTAATSVSSSGWSTTTTESRPGTSASDASLDFDSVQRQTTEPDSEIAFANKHWSRSQSLVELGAQTLDDQTRFHVESQEYFTQPPPAAWSFESRASGFVAADSTNESDQRGVPIPSSTSTSIQMTSTASTSHPAINSAEFGGSFEPLSHARSLAIAQAAAAQSFSRRQQQEHRVETLNRSHQSSTLLSSPSKQHESTATTHEEQPSPFNPWSWSSTPYHRRPTIRGSDATLRVRQDSIAKLMNRSNQHREEYESRFSFSVPTGNENIDQDVYMTTLQQELNDPERQFDLQQRQQQQYVAQMTYQRQDNSSCTATQSSHTDYVDVPVSTPLMSTPIVQTEASSDVMYVYLTREQAKDAQLVDSFLR